MDIIISNLSNEPIYEQISSQIRALIMKDSLKEGDALPSMRSLAKELRISVITTKHAYEELESSDIVSIRMSNFGAEIMLKELSSCKNKYRDYIIDKTTLDEILLFYVRGMDKGEWSL